MPPARCGACKRKSRFFGAAARRFIPFHETQALRPVQAGGLVVCRRAPVMVSRAGADSISARFARRKHPGRIWNPPLHGFFRAGNAWISRVVRYIRNDRRRDALNPPDPCAAANARGRDKSRPYGQRRGRGHCDGAPHMIGADSISARFTPRADMESAPTRFFRAGNAWISRVVRYIRNDRRAGCPHPAGPLRRRERPAGGPWPSPCEPESILRPNGKRQPP